MAQQSMALGMTDPSGAAATWRAYISRNVKNIVTASSIAAEFRSVGDPISINNRYNYKQRVVTGIHGTPFDQQTDENYWQSKQMLPNILRPLGSGIKNASIVNQGIYNINPIGGTNDFSGAVISRASGVNPTNYTLVGTDDLQDRIRANAVPANDPLSAQYASQLAPGAQIDPNNIEGDAQVNTFASKQSINRQAKTQLIDPNLVDPNSAIDDPTFQSGLMNKALNHQLRNHIARLTPGRRLRNAIQAHRYDQMYNGVRARLHDENEALIRENPGHADVIDEMVDQVQNDDEDIRLDDADVAAAGEPEGEEDEEEEAVDVEGPGIPPGGGPPPPGGGGPAGGMGGGRGGRGGGDDRGGRGIRQEARKDPMGQLSYTRGGSGYMGDSDHIALSAQSGESDTLQKVRRLVGNVKENFANDPKNKEIEALHERYANNNSSPAIQKLATDHTCQLMGASLFSKVAYDVRGPEKFSDDRPKAPVTLSGEELSEKADAPKMPGWAPGATTPSFSFQSSLLSGPEQIRSSNSTTDPVVMPGFSAPNFDAGPIAMMRRVIELNAGRLDDPNNVMVSELLNELNSVPGMYNLAPKEQVDYLLKIFARIQTSGKEIVRNAYSKVMRMLMNEGGFEKLLEMAQKQQDDIVAAAMDIENEGDGMKELLKMQENRDYAKNLMANQFNQRTILRKYFTQFQSGFQVSPIERGSVEQGRIYHLSRMFEMYKAKTQQNRERTSGYFKSLGTMGDNKNYAKGVAKGANALMYNKNKNKLLREHMDTAENAYSSRMLETGLDAIKNNLLRKKAKQLKFVSAAEAKEVLPEVKIEKGFNNANEKDIQNFGPLEPINSNLYNSKYVDLTDTGIDKVMDSVIETPFGRTNNVSLRIGHVQVNDFTHHLRNIADSARLPMDEYVIEGKGEKRKKDEAGLGEIGATRSWRRTEDDNVNVAAQGTAYSSHGGAVVVCSPLPTKLASAADNLSTTNLLQSLNNTSSLEDISAELLKTSTEMWERMSANFAQSLETVANQYLKDDDDKGQRIMDQINRRRILDVKSSFAEEYEYGSGVHYARNLKAFGAEGRQEVFANPTFAMIARRQEANAVMQMLGGYYRNTYARVMALEANTDDSSETAYKETRRFLSLMDRVMAENLPYEPVELLTMCASVGEKAAVRAMADWGGSNPSRVKRPARVYVQDVVPFGSGDVRFKVQSMGRDSIEKFQLYPAPQGKGSYVKKIN